MLWCVTEQQTFVAHVNPHLDVFEERRQHLYVVVVAKYKSFLARQLSKDVSQPINFVYTKQHITTVDNSVIRLYNTSPVVQHHLVHMINISKASSRRLASVIFECEDWSVVEVGIAYDESICHCVPLCVCLIYVYIITKKTQVVNHFY